MITRRKFIKDITLSSAGLMAAPYLLPEGRLFAPTGKRIANHVVFCLIAGGLRNFESIDKAEGNLLPNLLYGNEAISKDIIDGIDPLPVLKDVRALQSFGTLYKNFRYNSSDTVHYTGHAAAIMGVYSPNVGLMRPLNYPSIFEYYRKYNSPAMPATSAWWISDQAGPFTFLNYSDYPGYGPAYGANMLQPTSYFNNLLNNQHIVTAAEQENISHLQVFFNRHAAISKDKLTHQQIENTLDERKQLNQLLISLNSEVCSDGFDPWGVAKSVNEDILTMYSATKILTTFKPELLVLNMQHSDIGHTSFTKYCNNMRKADFALGHLWKTIQSTPGLSNDTILIAAPEFGRNLKSGSIKDAYGKYSIDHTGDENSKKIFCLIAGPEKIINRDVVITSETGETIDIVPTIARILGFDNNIPRDILKGRFLEEAFI